jgi:hypothetical protein
MRSALCCYEMNNEAKQTAVCVRLGCAHTRFDAANWLMDEAQDSAQVRLQSRGKNKRPG